MLPRNYTVKAIGRLPARVLTATPCITRYGRHSVPTVSPCITRYGSVSHHSVCYVVVCHLPFVDHPCAPAVCPCITRYGNVASCPLPCARCCVLSVCLHDRGRPPCITRYGVVGFSRCAVLVRSHSPCITRYGGALGHFPFVLSPCITRYGRVAGRVFRLASCSTVPRWSLIPYDAGC